jgi:hypothetical protein
VRLCRALPHPTGSGDTRRCPVTAVVMVLSLAAGVHAAVPAAAPAKQFRIEVKAYQGDPLGTRADGTVRCLVDAVVVTRSGSSAALLAGGQTPVQRPDGKLVFEETGLRTEILPLAYSNGVVWAEVSTTLRAVNVGLGNAGMPGFTEQNQRVARVVTPGEAFRVRVAAAAATDQTWVEVTIREQPPAGK